MRAIRRCSFGDIFRRRTRSALLLGFFARFCTSLHFELLHQSVIFNNLKKLQLCWNYSICDLRTLYATAIKTVSANQLLFYVFPFVEKGQGIRILFKARERGTGVKCDPSKKGKIKYSYSCTLKNSLRPASGNQIDSHRLGCPAFYAAGTG